MRLYFRRLTAGRWNGSLDGPLRHFAAYLEQELDTNNFTSSFEKIELTLAYPPLYLLPNLIHLEKEFRKEYNTFPSSRIERRSKKIKFTLQAPEFSELFDLKEQVNYKDKFECAGAYQNISELELCKILIEKIIIGLELIVPKLKTTDNFDNNRFYKILNDLKDRLSPGLLSQINLAATQKQNKELEEKNDQFNKIQALITSGQVDNIKLAFQLGLGQNFSEEQILKPWKNLVLFFEKHKAIKGNSTRQLLTELVSATSLHLNGKPLIELPYNIGLLQNLEQLYLPKTQLSSLPKSFSTLTKLNTLRLDNNQLTFLPENFGQLTNLKELELENNQLTSLPNSFIQLANLESLSLNENQLRSLPDDFGLLRKLNSLRLEDNLLTSLPESFGQLAELGVLLLYNNQLSSLPESFGQLKSLKGVSLVNNQLENLPESFGQLTVAGLRLGNNKFKSIPNVLAQIKSLNLLDLKDSDFSVKEQNRIQQLLPKVDIKF